MLEISEPIKTDLEQNLDYIKKKMDPDKNFDLVIRRIKIGDRPAALIFIDGFADGIVLSRVLVNVQAVNRSDVGLDIVEKLNSQFIPWIEVETTQNLDEGLIEILSGPQLLLIEGEKEGILIDARTWESRSPEEPELEKATRGPADGFSETLVFNVAALRRRLRDPDLRIEPLKVGQRSQTDIALIYIEDIAQPDLIDEIRDKLNQIDVDGLPLADKTVEEYLTGNKWSPFPMIRYTERPDTVAAHLLEGHLAIFVDTSPTALILPAPFLSQTQSLEEYRQGPFIGSYLTLLRILSVLIAVLLPPLWLLLVQNKELLPEFLEFLGPKEEYNLPLGLQFIFASLGIDIVRMASLTTPGALATALGLIGALFLGEFAVEVGLFAPEVILYVAAAAISTFSIPGFELSLLFQILRLFLLILVFAFNWLGFAGGIVLILGIMVFTKSFGVPYLWPLIPLNFKVLKTFLVRQSILTLSETRPPQVQDESRRRSGDK